MNLIKKLHPATYFFVFIIVAICFFLFSSFEKAQAGIYSWIQSAWDGGISSNIITSDTNTLSQVNNATVTQNSVSINSTPNWFDNSWSYRIPITIDNPNTYALTDHQIKITLDTSSLIASGKLQPDCRDIRFTNIIGNVVFPYWISEGSNECNSTTTNIWIKVDNLNIGSNLIYMYYGNPSATSFSNGEDTFLFFDDFNDGILDPNKWQHDGIGYSESDGKLTTWSNGSWRSLRSTYQIDFLHPVNVEARVISDSADDWHPLMLTDASNGNINRFGILDYFYSGSNIGIQIKQRSYTYPKDLGTMLPSIPYIMQITKDGFTSKFEAYFMNDNNTFINNYVATGLRFSNRPWVIRQWKRQSSQDHWDWILVSKAATEHLTITYPLTNEQKVYVSPSYVTSNIFNTTFPTEWNSINFSGSGTFTVKVRSDYLSNMSNAQDWSSCDPVTSGQDISSNNCINNGDQYIQFRVEFDPNGISYGEVNSVVIEYQEYDLDNPVTNASNVVLSGVSAGNWINFKPTINWDDATDNAGGSGIYGYCIALDETNGTSSNLDPAITGGILQGLDDGVPKTFCPFIVQGTTFDLNVVSGLNLTSGKTYFVSIKAVDNGGNIFSGASTDYQDLTNFKFDNMPPENPAFINLPVNFVSTKDITISWPVGAAGASDTFSGVAGLQYKIGQNGTWYGDLHNGSQDITDLLVDDGVYTTDPTYDYPNLAEGVNKIYFRTLDNAGNISATTLQGDIKINTVAPSEVQNLSVNPFSNTVNQYEFTWDPPATFTGLVSGITYCYTVNVLPSESSCNYTLPGETSIGPGAFATQPGINTMYIVARDEASNVNYATFQSINFEYNGTAPGIPTNLDVADISIKSTSNWRLALSWDTPNDVGAGVANYKIFRSLNTDISCASSFGSFTQIGSSTSTSYIDTGLSQVPYNYCIVACDSANNCSAPTGNVVKTPTGKYTEPAKLITEPEVIQVGTRTAKINWVTERTSDSRIQLGVESGKYFDEEISNSDQVTNHIITLNNLDPGKTYFYRALWIDEDGNVGVSSEKIFVTKPAPLLENTNVTAITTSSAIINLSVANATQVRIVIPGFFDEYIPTSTEFSTYSIPLTNLRENTRYSFRIYLKDVDGYEYDTFEDRVFQTLPLPQITDVSFEELKGVASPTIAVRWKTNVPTVSTIYYKNLDSEEGLISTIPNTERKEEFEENVSGLKPETTYSLYIVATDVFGNSARSNEFTFTTATDTRPPEIVGIKIGKSNTGDEGNNAQLIVTIDTDEPTTAQVEYGEGSSGVYTQATPIDTIYKTQHNIIINELKPNAVYNLRVIVSDSALNRKSSSNKIIVTSKSQQEVLEIVLGELSELFGFVF
ncbi:MAG: hypothetical protein KatS3mg085_331 [Candidatus Dojkabacteria bacterium]|nr:MAG: hypothetical protein KatS3mg085_331 [Candidatus Dojkabacteria bacterium]